MPRSQQVSTPSLWGFIGVGVTILLASITFVTWLATLGSRVESVEKAVQKLELSIAATNSTTSVATVELAGIKAQLQSINDAMRELRWRSRQVQPEAPKP